MRILLAEPRGFCAGVDRAIQIVETCLQRYGPPVYVRHEIVHNARVVKELEAKGAIFVDTLDAVPGRDRPVVFSAHGVARSVQEKARQKGLDVIDACCPLVTKVHKQAQKAFGEKRHLVLVGHRGHAEIIGTMGQLPKGAVSLIETEEQARRFIPPSSRLSFATQTTLSVDETRSIRDILQKRFPDMRMPAKQDICYATSNRQNAVKALAEHADMILIVGDAHSSNAQRLVEVARQSGCPFAQLVGDCDKLPWQKIDQKTQCIGVSAGASAPESLVSEIVGKLQKRLRARLEVLESGVAETTHFPLPRRLRDEACSPHA